MSIAEETLQKQPGDWFGPASTAHLIREASLRCQGHSLLNQLAVYVAQDSTVYKSDVRRQSKAQSQRRRILSRKLSSRSATSPVMNAEEFSLVEAPTEYPQGLIPTSSVNHDKGRLFSGVVDGVPYFEEANEVGAEVGDFQMLSDQYEHFSLNQPIFVDGEEWVAEGKSETEFSSSAHSEAKPSTNSSHSDWTPTLILIPLRLGTDKLNPIYIPSLKALLSTENCVGIIGGRPRHSLYFVGFQDDSLIHLDPHLVQDNVNVFRHNFSVDSFHCQTPRKMNVHKMDPSCCFGFFCPTEQSFEGWCEIVKELAVPPGRLTDYPMFTVADGTSKDSMQRLSTSSASSRIADLDWGSTSVHSEIELPVSEDFVFL